MIKTIDLLSFGSCYIDINSTNFPFDKQINEETETVGDAYHVMLGGSAVISVSVAASLGLQPTFIGKTGDDLFSTIKEQKFQEKGIGAHLVKSSEKKTNLSMNYVNPHGRSIMLTVGSANQSFSYSELQQSLNHLLPKTKYLYLGGVFKLKKLTKHYSDIVRQAKESGCKILLDHGRITNIVSEDQQQMIKDILPFIDIYIPSKSEAMELWGGNTVEKTLNIVKTHAPEITVIITQAKAGALGISSEGEKAQSRARKVKVINTVGAGDSFNAGFLVAQEQGMNFPDSLQFAQAVAEYKISHLELPKLSDILQ